jgi:hypothetical protein
MNTLTTLKAHLYDGFYASAMIGNSKYLIRRIVDGDSAVVVDWYYPTTGKEQTFPFSSLRDISFQYHLPTHFSL